MRRLLYVLIGHAFFTIGCAGPSSPFGAIHTLTPDQRSEDQKDPVDDPAGIKEEDTNKNLNYPPVPEIRFYPKRFKVHASHPWRIEMEDVQNGKPQEVFQVTYNGIDVTDQYFRLAEVARKNETVVIEFPFLHMPAGRSHDVEFSYTNTLAQKVRVPYRAPRCSVYERSHVLNTNPFTPPEQYVNLIEQLAPRSNMNPALVAGVVAQESGFDAEAVSWAKAIGLTQMTPLAEEQILDEIAHFPRYPNLNDLSYLRIKSLIMSGQVNGQKEWRLNPEYSIRGGLAYLSYVDDYWRMKDNLQFLDGLAGNSQIIYSQVLLASYNSGPARVKLAIKEMGDKWLKHENLQEARKYVNRVFSYCYHFSQVQKSSTQASVELRVPYIMAEE